MIPKVIHYCWFGRNPLLEDAKKCIASWRKYFPDYEIREWNEDNFDVNEIPYTAEAYAAGKYAFVSDYARFKILYEHGGIYFDTDVEVIKPFDDILELGAFMGVEIGPCREKGYKNYKKIIVNPGLGVAVEKGNIIYKDLIDKYKQLRFVTQDGLNTVTICKYTTETLENYGLKLTDDFQNIKGITIFPPDWFNPFDDATGNLQLTANTHSIHWYSKSWLRESRLRRKLSRLSHRVFGTRLIPAIRKFFV